MLKSSLYEQCSEQIYCFAYGDSLHLRYITLYTSFDRLYVIAENKYNLTKHIQTIDWKDDSIIQMRFDTFKIHILTMNGQYSQLVLGEVFENNFKLRDKLQSIILKDVNFLPNLKPDGFTKFQDFVFYNKKILFLTQAGTLIQFEQDKQIISNIIYIRVQLSSVTVQRIDDREYFLGITEFNDLVKMTIDDQEPQFTRFADKNYSIKQLFITEKNLIILKENKQEVILAKYDILTLKLLKNYHLLVDDQDLKFIDIQELPKIFVCQVFDQQNKIIVLSKKVMKFPYKKELEFKLQQLEDEQKNHFDLDFSTYNTAIISQVETKNEILHISKFKMQFGFKVTKQQVQNTLINCQQYNANLQILDSERSSLNNYFPNQALVITLTQIRIVSFDNQQKFGFEFKQLQQWENYCNTFNQKQLYPQSWQEKIKILMWNKVNQELGIEDYLKKKQETDQEMLNWVSSIQTNKSMQDQLDFDKDRIYLEQQYDKSLATIALLRFSNFSNEITISIIIYLVFKKQFPFTSEIIRQNSQQFLIFLQYIKNQKEGIFNYELWRDYQQLLFILIIILEVRCSQIINDLDIKIIQPIDKFEPVFITKIRSLIESPKTPQQLKIKLIILTKDVKYQKEYFMAIFKIQDKSDILEFALLSNLLTHKPSFNIHTFKNILSNIDTLYIDNLVKISGYVPQKPLGLQEQLKEEIEEDGLIFMKALIDIPIENDYFKIVQWLYD